MTPSNKRLVVCCDGTWQEPSSKVGSAPQPTNVLKVVRGVAPATSDGIHQIVCYDQGIGTGGGIDKVLGGMFGKGISENIAQAYRFIANNHVDGDELYLFGFSRGAYTVRSLAGFIGAVGLLHKAHLDLVPEAYALYRLPPRERAKSISWERIRALSPDPRHPIPVRFIGVWDTVGALGAPTPCLRRLTKRHVSFHDTQLGADVENAYHALAVDERRRPFEPDLWTIGPADDQHRTIEQVWFRGEHSDVGGGSSKHLSDITLRWMADQAQRHGLEFTAEFRREAQSAPAVGTESAAQWYYPKRPRRIGAQQANGQPVGTIGESVHPSAVQAIGQLLQGDAAPYEPQNLKRAIDAGLPTWRGD